MKNLKAIKGDASFRKFFRKKNKNFSSIIVFANKEKYKNLIIYDAINDLKDAMEGMLSPDLKEEVSGNAEIRETFKISKIGTIAGCMMTDGKVYRKSNVRLIRDGIVITSTTLASLKRFQDDVKEVSKGYDCGIQLKNYNDIKVGDVLEFYNELEVKKKIKS